MPASHSLRWFPSLRQAGILNDAGAIVDVAALEKLDFVDVLTCQRPSDILRHLGITHIHVWVLDVEGGELEVLEAFNFNPASGGVSVDVIMLEVNDAGSPKFPKIVEVLAAAGLRHRDGAGHPNHYFLRDGFVPISK